MELSARPLAAVPKTALHDTPVACLLGPHQSDKTAGSRRLAEQRRPDYMGGVLLYAGDSAFALGDGRSLAMPLARLWDM